jgi:lipopolysaccharide assembly outer membrane protein LptD (OstA)
VAYEYQHRNFKTLDTRDADQHSGAIMAYYSPVKGTMFNIGYKLARETAVGPEYDFWGHYFDAGVKVKLPMPGVEPTFRASYRYYKKDFSNITPSIGVKRDDKRHDIKTSVEVPIVGNLSGKLQYEYIKSISNLPSVDYPENRVTFSLGWSL